MEAVEGTNGFVPVIPWFTDPDYREPVSKTFERTPDEEELADKYNLVTTVDVPSQEDYAELSTYSIRSILHNHPAFLNTSSVFNPEQLNNASMMRKT